MPGLSGVATDFTSYLAVVKTKAKVAGVRKLYKQATPIIKESFTDKLSADACVRRLVSRLGTEEASDV